jgi:hemolysin III
MDNTKKNIFIKKPPLKPLLRGFSHQAACFFSMGVSLMLLLKTNTKIEFIALSIYSLSLIFLFGVSAVYHIPNWNSHVRIWMKRLDHCAIYILIAGTGTPICLLGINSHAGKILLILTWSIATIGVLQSLFWVKAPRILNAILYLIAGWGVIPFWHDLKNALTINQIVYILLGGISYSLGAIFYAIKKPKLMPLIFGYHELFHLLVIVGAGLQFKAIYSFIN